MEHCLERLIGECRTPAALVDDELCLLSWNEPFVLICTVEPQTMLPAHFALGLTEGQTALAPGCHCYESLDGRCTVVCAKVFAGKEPTSFLLSVHTYEPHSERVLFSPHARYSELSRRKREVLCRVLAGLSNKEIASQLNLSVSAIKKHVHELLRRFEVRGRVQLASMFPQALAREIEVPGLQYGNSVASVKRSDELPRHGL